MKSSYRWSIVVCLAFVLAPSVFADSDEELRDQQEKQRQVQAETDHVVRRITTMMRVMQFYRIQSPEKEILKEMSGTLSGLSKNQMSDVIRQLETAAQTKDEKLSDEAREKAYESHRQVVAALHEMVSRFDAIKSLEEAAGRFDRHAKTQLDLHVQTGQAARDVADTYRPEFAPARGQLIGKRNRATPADMKRHGDNQSDLERDVALLVKQVRDLASKLPAEQQERIKAMDKLIVEFGLFENMTQAAKKLRTAGYVPVRQQEFQAANDLQWQTTGNLQALARVLRVPADTLAALKEAREKIEQAIARQEEIKEEVKLQEEKAAKEDNDTAIRQGRQVQPARSGHAAPGEAV